MTYAMVYNGEIRRLSNFRLDTLLYYSFSIFLKSAFIVDIEALT